ncbi:hypothetical protein [Falsiroseomonas tokyonensis]|uniref:Uncharacterized protein n=1 Tax=Falsiroseomonas tokyonensis TaxID=430521 RepID=A0ABV7BWP2_9PROT|nr:hypothetical protein [Falsiroseomonas tokyonensis]MBU8540098.1 hypothetical protein [Falsiroseomonas tokyonensis]
MLEPGTLKLLAAIVVFSVPVWLFAAVLPGRVVAGLRLNRAQAQGLGAVVGLVLGVGFLLALG